MNFSYTYKRSKCSRLAIFYYSFNEFCEFSKQSASLVGHHCSARPLLGALSLCGGVLALAYAGNVFSFLAVAEAPRLVAEIRDLADAADAGAAPARVGNTDPDSAAPIASHPDRRIRALADRWETVGSWEEGMRRAEGGDLVFMNSRISTLYHARTASKPRYSYYTYIQQKIISTW